MHEYLPILIVGAIIGVFTILFVVVFALEKNKKETMGFERHMSDSEIIRRLLAYAKGIPGTKPLRPRLSRVASYAELTDILGETGICF